MGVAYCLVYEQALDKPIGDSKAEQLALHTDELNHLLESQSLKLIDDYVIEDFSDLDALAEELHVDFTSDDDTDSTEQKWFDAAEGVRWVDQLVERVQNSSPTLSSNDSLMEDIKTLKGNLEQAVEQGIKWHLKVDFDA